MIRIISLEAIIALIILCGITLSAAAQNILPTQNFLFGDKGNTKAIVIGISNYSSISDLQYSDRDAILFAEFLKNHLDGVTTNIQLLINEDATFGKIQSAFTRLLSNVEKNDNVIIYFSGHGDIETQTDDRHGFLLTHNSFANNYWGSALPVLYLQSIITTLSNRGASVIVITDACKAGQLAGDKVKGRELTGLALAQQFNNEIKIMSCAPDEESLESAIWGEGRGVFSYFLEKALSGAADANTDGLINLRELEDYLEEEVARNVAPHQQHPEIQGRKNTNVIEVRESITYDGAIQDDNLSSNYHSRSNKKGINDTNLYTDKTTSFLYDAFKNAISQGEILEPIGASAYDWYKRIIESGDSNDAKVANEVTLQLKAAVLDQVQSYLHAYITNDLATEDFNTILKALAYIDLGLKLVAKDDYAYSDLESKQYFFLGLLYEIIEGKESSKSFEKAIDYFSKASTAAPLAAYPYDALGRVYKKMDEKDKAIAACQQASDLAPTWKMPPKRLRSLLPDEKNESIELVIDTTELMIPDTSLVKGSGKMDFSNVELSDKLIKLPKTKNQILVHNGGATYGIQLVNQKDKKGVTIRWYSKLGSPLNKNDEVVFYNDTSYRRAYRFENEMTYNNSTSTYQNDLVIDIEALIWFASNPITKISLKNNVSNESRQLNLPTERQRTFSKLAADFLQLLLKDMN